MKTIYKNPNNGISRRVCLTLPLITLLFILLAGQVPAQTTNFSFTQIPYSDPDFIAPHRGTEEWMVMNQVNVPVEGIYTNPMDAYYRFEWTHIEAGKGVYNWSVLDAAFKRAIDKGQKFSFGIMPICSNCTGTSVGGAKLTYPGYLHSEMQSESVKDWNHNGVWIPNWNSNYFLTAWENMLKAVAAHINTTYINGVKLSNIVNYIDIRGYGNWGEWHNYPYGDVEPTASRATAASLLRLVNSHKVAFPDIRLVALTDAFDVANWSRVPAEAGYALLTGSNNAGQYGWRRDNWGDPASWYKNKFELNSTTYNGQVFSNLIMNKWKYAPIVGEPSSCCTMNGGSCQYWEMEAQMRRYHTLSFGNGNLESPSSTCVRNNIRNAAKAAGYRLVILGGNMTTSLSGGSSFSIQLNWQNVGITPTYEKWDVVYQLRNSSNAVVWSGTSTFKPHMFLPQTTATLVQDNFVLPSTVAAGTYNLVMVVNDPGNYRKPLPLAIRGRNADGSYPIRSLNVTQGTAVVTNKLPVANAGADQSITLPANTVELNGSSSSDPEGSTLTYKWSQIGGPSTASLTNTTLVAATANSLIQGVYSFRLTVFDSQKDSSYDDVLVTINPAPAPVAPPVIASISNSRNVICFGSTTGSATVSASGGTAPYTYSWSSNPVQTTASATSLAAGTYTATVRDAAGKIATATVAISQPALLDLTVTPGTITSYGGSTSVALSATGGTTPYAYSGPTTGVYAGTYTYVVKDANGCTDSQTVTISEPAVKRIRKQNRKTQLWSTTTNTGTLPKGTQAKEIQVMTSLMAYPNPASDIVTLEMNNEWSGRGTISLFNIQGSKVLQSEFTKPSGYFQQKLNIGSLTNGIYMITIHSTYNIVESIKIIKQ